MFLQLAFKPSSEMSFATAQADCERLKYWFQNLQRDLIIDLSEVTYCDSAGLALLLEAQRLCKQRNSTCKMIGVSEPIRALAAFCNVEELFRTL